LSQESEAKPARSLAAANLDATAIKASVTVMVVDDESGLLDMMVSALRRSGFAVISAKTGEDAIELYRANVQRIDLAILDLVLPQMSGWELFSQMRGISPLVQVLIMSGHLEPKLESAVSKSGAQGFIQKPFAMATFLRRVSEILPAKET
jgi:two-component system cell cycle sensor histidine kinase/response regulator CckA